MSKKSEYSKVFGGGGKADRDFDVKNKKSAKHDIFFNEIKKKKKKKKKKDVNKVLEKSIKGMVSDGNPISEFLVWEKLKDTDIRTFADVKERCSGLFVLEVWLQENNKALVPVIVTKNKEILHADTGESIEEVFTQYTIGNDVEITDIDIQTVSDALISADIIESIYVINTEKLMQNINMFDSDDIKWETF